MVEGNYRQRLEKLETHPTRNNLAERVELLAKTLGVQTISCRRFVSLQTIYSDLKNLSKRLTGVA